MSYILDALRRADADRERERGAVPGLHARPLPGTLAEPRSATPPALWLAAGAGVLAVAAVLAWWLLRSPAAPPAAPRAVGAPGAAPGPAPSAMPQQAGPAPGAVAMTAPPPAAVVPAGPGGLQAQAPTPGQSPLPGAAAVPPPGSALPPLPQMASPRPAPPLPRAGDRPAPAAGSTPVAEAPQAASPATAPGGPPAATAPQPATAKGPAGAPARSAEAQPRATPLAELPPELRREMPAMSVGGSIYSDNAASRFIIVNGQVVREGESPATGVVIERIGAKSAVLRWREMRIEVPL